MDMNSTPKLAPGCRLHPQQPILLVPEGTLNLTGPARDILAQLDGKQTLGAIIDALLEQYSGAPKEAMTKDVLTLLERMQQRGLVRS
jgi:pyrroloquinoline quinone biosynthesis protein D